MQAVITKHNRSILPAGIAENLKLHSKKTKVVFHVQRKEIADIVTGSMQWEEGSRSYYYVNDTATPERMLQLAGFPAFSECKLPYNGYAVTVSIFCGVECPAVFTLREKDVPAFFGVERPREHADTPADIFADWIEEQAEHADKKEAKRLRDAAKKIRLVMGV